MFLHLRDSAGHQWYENLDLYFDGISFRALDQSDFIEDEFSEFRNPSLLPPWKYRSGDDMAYADPGFDDSSWERVWPGKEGTGWARLHIPVNPTLWDKPLSLKARQGGASEIYLDGRLIFGEVESKGEEKGYWENQKVILLNRKEHIFAVRYSSFSEGRSSIMLREANQSVERREEDLKISSYLMFFAGIPAAFALLHLVLFLFYRRARQNLYFAIFIACVAVYVIIPTQMIILPNFEQHLITWLDKYIGQDWLFIMFMFGIVPLLLGGIGLRFLYSLFYTRLPRQFWGILLLGVGIAIWSSYAISISVLIIPAVIILEILRVIVMAIYRKKEGAKIIGGGVVFFLVSIGLLVIGVTGGFIGDSAIFGVVGISMGILGLLVSMSVHLGRTFARTSTDLETKLVQVEELSAKNLEQERALRAEAEKELQTAHEMQMALMPKAPPRIAGLEITGRCIPANHVGGDLFQYFHQDRKLSISLADVTGHAMEAAIPVVMFSGILKSQMEMGGSVEELFRRLNRSLHGTLTGRTFVCLAMGELDPASRLFRFSNSGCPYPYHFRAVTGEVTELQVDAYPLGVRPDTTYQTIEVQLEPGDRVVFCSDGIIEATNEAGEMFGFERTAEVIRQGCVEGLSAEALLERIIEEVKTFSQGVPQGDDQTVVVLKVER